MRVVRRALRRGARLCVRGLRARLLRRVRAARRRALPLLLRSAAPPQLNAPRRARYNQRPARARGGKREGNEEAAEEIACTPRACAGRKKARKSPPANAGGRVLPAKFFVKFSVKKSDILPG